MRAATAAVASAARAARYAKVIGGVNAGLGGTLKPFHITLIDQIQAPTYNKGVDAVRGATSAPVIPERAPTR